MLVLVSLHLLFVGGLCLTIAGYLNDHQASFVLGSGLLALSTITMIVMVVRRATEDGEG